MVTAVMATVMATVSTVASGRMTMSGGIGDELNCGASKFELMQC
jgi:hypothetical protein